MKYFGGKARIGKQIASVINEMGAESYHEPFCGLFSVGRHITAQKRSGADTHRDLVLLLQAVQNGWTGPDCVSEEEYQVLKKAEPSALRGFVGFGCSFGGKFFGGYARDDTDRNYALNAQRSLKKLAPQIVDVSFYQQDYLEYKGGAQVIYCDPPYRGTTGFTQGEFDSKEFWDWVLDISKDAAVFVSEYNAPDGFGVVWQKSVNTDMNGKAGKLKRVENLFRKG